MELEGRLIIMYYRNLFAISDPTADMKEGAVLNVSVSKFKELVLRCLSNGIINNINLYLL